MTVAPWNNHATDTSTFDRLRDTCNKMFQRDGHLRGSSQFAALSPVAPRVSFRIPHSLGLFLFYLLIVTNVFFCCRRRIRAFSWMAEASWKRRNRPPPRRSLPSTPKVLPGRCGRSCRARLTTTSRTCSPPSLENRLPRVSFSFNLNGINQFNNNNIYDN